MADNTQEPADLTLHYLHRLDENVSALRGDVRELKIRMTSVEQGLAAVNQSLALQSGRIDRIEIRLERIERRLDLVEQH
jgi:hypothetical protein